MHEIVQKESIGLTLEHTMYLVEASEKEKRDRDTLTYAAWGDLLTFDQYLKRESILRSETWAKNCMTTWLLRDGEKPVASCETFEMKSLYYGSSLERKKAVGIGSVFVEPKLRGRGYSSKLIELLIHRYKNENLNQYHSMFLYSEIGESIYRKVGFDSVASKEWVFPVMEKRNIGKSLEVRAIHRAKVDKLASNIEILNENDFIIQATPEQYKWHFRRQDLYAEFLNRENTDQIGLACEGSHLIWMIDYKYNILRGLSFKAENSKLAAALIGEAMNFAKMFGLTEVRLWIMKKSDFFLNNTFDERNISARDDSIAMILPLSGGIKSANWLGVQRAIWI
jgi:GNAT superfamily N-acetyltransferase